MSKWLNKRRSIAIVRVHLTGTTLEERIAGVPRIESFLLSCCIRWPVLHWSPERILWLVKLCKNDLGHKNTLKLEQELWPVVDGVVKKPRAFIFMFAGNHCNVVTRENRFTNWNHLLALSSPGPTPNESTQHAPLAFHNIATLTEFEFSKHGLL